MPASALPRFVVLYALMYGAFGVSSPFMPAFFESRGLSPQQLGAVFAAATAIRLVSGPFAGRLADLTHAVRGVLAACTALSALVAAGLLPAHGFATILVIAVCHAAALAPITTLADALALGAAVRRDAAPGFEYGWVRGTGSALFVAGTLASGQVVSRLGLGSIVVLQAALLATAACAAMRVPSLDPERLAHDGRADGAGLFDLLRAPRFLLLLLVSALVLGSHAMHDTFAVIRWSAAGVSPAMTSVLWSESVAAEVVVFFVVGPRLVRRLGPPGTVALAATAGALRWVVMASTADVAALALMQPLHGLTFAALHLACMRLIADLVPRHLAATAQALYALGAGATTAVLTLASGDLYARLGASGFLVMAALSASAMPLALGLRSDRRPSAA